MAPGTELGLSQCDIVLDGDPLPPKRGTAPPILAYVYCAQTARRIKMKVGTEIGLSPGHVVSDGDRLSLPKRGTAP